MLQKWRNSVQFRRFWCESQTAGHAPDDNLFRNVASRRDAYTIIAAFEVKKEIPIQCEG